jgi:cell division FtsZ-interacting protein ZapD
MVTVDFNDPKQVNWLEIQVLDRLEELQGGENHTEEINNLRQLQEVIEKVQLRNLEIKRLEVQKKRNQKTLEANKAKVAVVDAFFAEIMNQSDLTQRIIINGRF